MNKSGGTGILRLVNAYRASWAGLTASWQNENAFRQEVIVAAAAVPLAFLLGDSPLEYALLVSSIVFVLIVELLNSAIEATVDRIGLERHELSGRAKDMGSAAVMISLSLAILVWLLVALGHNSS